MSILTGGCEPDDVGAIQRARYRYGFDRAVPLSPAEPFELRIRLSHVGHTFLPAHRIRLEVSSSCFPLADPNTNTGADIAIDSAPRKAHTNRASRCRVPVCDCLLPVLPSRDQLQNMLPFIIERNSMKVRNILLISLGFCAVATLALGDQIAGAPGDE